MKISKSIEKNNKISKKKIYSGLPKVPIFFDFVGFFW